MWGKWMAYTTMFTTLDDDAKYLVYEDAQRGETRCDDDRAFIHLRLGITYLRRRLEEQECLYAPRL